MQHQIAVGWCYCITIFQLGIPPGRYCHCANSPRLCVITIFQESKSWFGLVSTTIVKIPLITSIMWTRVLPQASMTTIHQIEVIRDDTHPIHKHYLAILSSKNEIKKRIKSGTMEQSFEPAVWPINWSKSYKRWISILLRIRTNRFFNPVNFRKTEPHGQVSWVSIFYGKIF